MKKPAFTAKINDWSPDGKSRTVDVAIESSASKDIEISNSTGDSIAISRTALRKVVKFMEGTE